MTKQNLTVQLDTDVIRKARILAADVALALLVPPLFALRRRHS